MKTIVITGASSGIGLAAVKACLARGHRVLATARRQEDLDRLQTLGAIPVALELGDPSSVEAAAAEIRELADDSIDVLFNNAGYGLQVAMEDCNWQSLEAQLRANTVAPVILSNLLLPALGRGSRLVFNSSSLGLFVVPFRGPYCMSKYALEAAADAYRMELGPLGIRVQLIEPGPIEANFRRNAYNNLRQCLGDASTRLDYTQHVERLQAEKLTEGTLPAAAVADIFIGMVEGRNDKPRYRVTRIAKIGVAARWLLGSSFDALASKMQPVVERAPD